MAHVNLKRRTLNRAMHRKELQGEFDELEQPSLVHQQQQQRNDHMAKTGFRSKPQLKVKSLFPEALREEKINELIKSQVNMKYSRQGPLQVKANVGYKTQREFIDRSAQMQEQESQMLINDFRQAPNYHNIHK